EDVETLIPSIPASSSECAAYFAALKKQKHRSGYGPGDEEYNADFFDFEDNGYYSILLRRIMHSNPPWADSPPQLTLRLQRALHTHFTTRPPLIQYYDSVMPPAYQDHRLFTNLLHFCSSYFPPSLCEITGKV